MKGGIAYIYNQYVNDLYNYGTNLGFEKELVMDAIHDIFCKLATDDKVLHDILNVKLYLFKSLKNRLFDIYKIQQRHVRLTENDVNETPFNIQVTIEDRFIDKEDRQSIENQITEMLGSLTDRQREIVYLRYVQEYDYIQISELLNITVHGCRKLMSKAIQNLRKKYGPLILLLLLN